MTAIRPLWALVVGPEGDGAFAAAGALLGGDQGAAAGVGTFGYRLTGAAAGGAGAVKGAAALSMGEDLSPLKGAGGRSTYPPGAGTKPLEGCFCQRCIIARLSSFQDSCTSSVCSSYQNNASPSIDAAAA